MSSEVGEGHVSWRGVGCVAAGAAFGFVSKAFERSARARWMMSNPSWLAKRPLLTLLLTSC